MIEMSFTKLAEGINPAKNGAALEDINLMVGGKVGQMNWAGRVAGDGKRWRVCTLSAEIKKDLGN